MNQTLKPRVLVIYDEETIWGGFCESLMKRLLILFVLVVLFLMGLPASSASAAEPIILTQDHDCYVVGLHLDILNDPGRKFTIEDVTAPPVSRQFTPSREATPSFGFASSTHWLRFLLVNSSNESCEWVLELQSPTIDQVDLYSGSSGRDLVRRASGDSVPFKQWEIEYNQPAFRLTIPPGESLTCYLRLESTGLIRVPLFLRTLKAFESHAYQEQLWSGLYFGAAMVIVICGMFLWFVLRDRTHMYFVLSSASLPVTSAIFTGLAYQYLWPSWPSWNTPALMLFGGITEFSLMGFVRSFVRSEEYAPKLDKLARMVMLSAILVCVLAFFAHRRSVELGIAVSAIWCVLTPILSVRAYLKGYKPALSFLMAYLLLMLTLFVWTFAVAGAVAYSTALTHLTRVGQVVTWLLVAGVLANRYRVLQSEYGASLEREVDGRTMELAETNRALKNEMAERLSVEKELFESRALLTNILALSPVGIGRARRGKIVWLNKTFAEMFGFESEDDYVGKSTSMVYASEGEFEKVNRMIAGGLENGRLIETDSIFRRKDGSTFEGHFRLTVGSTDPSSQSREIIAAITDISERKQAEKALRESEEALRASERRYRQLVENANDFISLVDTDGFFLLVNPTGLRLTGYSKEEIIGKRYLDLVRPDFEQKAGEFYQRQLLEKTCDTYFECPIITKNGQTRWFGHNVQLVTEGEKVSGFQSISRDITERKQAEEKLRESQERFRELYEESKTREELYLSLLNSSPDSIVIYDMEGRTQHVNPSFTRIFGWTMEEVRGKRIEFVPDSERERTLEVIRGIVEEDISASAFETFRYTKDRKLIPVSISASRCHDHEGKPAGMLVILRDITLRKRTQQAVIETKERLQLALAAAGSDMWESELQTGKHVPAVNLFRRLGYTAPEIPVSWEDMWEMVHPDELEEVKCAYLRVVAGKASEMHSDYRMRAESGDWIWCSSFGKVVERDDHGHPLRLVGLTMDINDQMEAKRRIAEAAELEAVQRGKIQMASSVLHDIGNAVTSLVVAVSKLIGEAHWPEIPELVKLERMIEQKREAFASAMGPGKDEALMAFVGALAKSLEDRWQRLQRRHQSMARTLGHVREILNLQRRYARDGRWGETDVLDLRELIEDALAIHSGGFEKRGITVRRSIPSELAPISGDRTKLIQVLLNIFRNASEAFDEKDQEEDRVLDIVVESVQDRAIRLTASDNALGFDPELTERLFEEGYSTKGRDSGLGLFQCRAIIENHGGSLRLESRGLGQGTRAIIELPA